MVCPKCKKNEIKNVPQIWLKAQPHLWVCSECADEAVKTDRQPLKKLIKTSRHGGTL